MAKQKLSSKAAAAKKRRDIAMAKTPVRKAKKAQNQRIGQRSDSDIHHKNDGSVIRTSIKKNRGNFGRGTKNENNMKKKSSMAKKKFGPKTMKKTTGKSGNLKDVISDVRTKAADVVGKIHSGFDKPLVKNFPGDSAPKNVLGHMAIAAGKVGGQILENVIRPGKQSGPDFKGLGNQLTESLEKADKEVKSVTKMKRRSDGSMAKLKGQSFMKRMKMMNEASPMQFGPKRKTTKKKLPVDPLDVKGKIKKTADAADKEMKNLISNVRNIAKTDVPRAVAGDAKKLLNKIGKFVKTSKSRKSGGIFGK